MSCSKVAPNPRFSPLESLNDGDIGQSFEGEDGVVAATGVEIGSGFCIEINQGRHHWLNSSIRRSRNRF